MSRDLKNLKIDPSNIKSRVNKSLATDLRERKMYMKYRILRGAAIAAALSAALATSVFAMTPAGQETIGNIISYFRSEQACEITNYESLAAYNDKIGVNDTKNGFTLTLDNVAADDNFVHVFYTITSEEPFIDDLNSTDITGPMVWADVILDGHISNSSGNHSEFDGYFEDCCTMKLVKKINISTKEIPDKFKLEIIASDGLIKSEEWGVDLSRFYPADESDPVFNLTDEEKSRILYVSTDIDKSKVKVATVTYNINQKLDFTGAELEKVIFSPFGNQLVMKSETHSSGSKEAPEETISDFTGFALFDGNGKSLDVLNTDLSFTDNGISRNSYEFLKADASLKQLTFVPLRYNNTGDRGPIIQKIGTYPMTFEVNDYGKVVVTDIRISNSIIEIDYYYDGFIDGDPEFDILNDNGDNVYPKTSYNDLRCLYDTIVNHSDNSYTAKYTYYYYDDNDTAVKATEVSEEILRNQFTSISMQDEHYLSLDYENAITVDLK